MKPETSPVPDIAPLPGNESGPHPAHPPDPLPEVPEGPTDEALMQACGRGDLHAFEQLVRRHQEGAWDIAVRFLGDSGEAADMVQKAFMKILEAAPRYRPTAAFRTYLYCVLSRLCLDHFRARRTFQDADVSELPGKDPSPVGILLAAERDRAVREALRGLPSRQRLAVILKYYNQLSYQEIAAVMEVSAKAVERLLARARESLEPVLSPWLKESF